MLVRSADSYSKLHGGHIKCPSRITAYFNNFCLHMSSLLVNEWKLPNLLYLALDISHKTAHKVQRMSDLPHSLLRSLHH